MLLILVLSCPWIEEIQTKQNIKELLHFKCLPLSFQERALSTALSRLQAECDRQHFVQIHFYNRLVYICKHIADNVFEHKGKLTSIKFSFKNENVK